VPILCTYAVPKCCTMQRASVKLLLKENKKNALGKYPIYLRITTNRKTSFISTGHFIYKNQWDEKTESVKESHVLYEEINTDILNRKKQILDEILQAAIDKRFKSASAIKQVIADELKNIFRFSERLQEEVRHRRSESTIDNYQKHMKKLQGFVGDDKLLFDQVDADYLRSFENWLRKNIKVRKDPNNYIAAIMRTIRSHFNEAISRGLTNNYPFKNYKLPTETPGNKDFLSLSELKKWHEFTFETQHETFKEVALYFLFGCYTGLRLSDWKDFAEGKLRQKNISLKATKNKAWVNVPLHARLIEVIKLMKEIQLVHSEPSVNRNLKLIADALKVNKKLSTHSARRTFAVTMCLERGISSETAAKLMGITLAVFEKNYSFVTAEKLRMETSKAWDNL
jgi:site-specific recombinase XerD